MDINTNTEFTTKVLTEDERSLMLSREVASSEHHTAAYWYAWGRLDQGHEPVVNSPVYSTRGTPDTVSTAWWFGYLYHSHRTKAAANQTGSVGLPSAWQNFVASKGNQIEWIR